MLSVCDPQSWTAKPAHRQGVKVGALRLLVPFDQASALIDHPSIEPVPFAPPWLAGIANVQGDPIPVVDLLRALKLPPCPLRPADRLLVLGRAHDAAGIVIDGLPQLVRLGSDLRPVAHAAPRFLAPFVVAAFQTEGTEWLEADWPGLLDAMTSPPC